MGTREVSECAGETEYGYRKEGWVYLDCFFRVTYQFRRDHRVYSDKQSSCMTFELSSEIAFCSMKIAHGTSTHFDLLGCQQRRTTSL